MPRYHIVTDSSARFARTSIISQYGIHVLPNVVEVGERTFREDIDLSAEDMLRLIGGLRRPPTVRPPSVADFAALYQQLARNSDGIISLHPSREMNASWENAHAASGQAAGSVPITVIDTRTLCAGQGMLVRLAAQSALDGLPYDTIVKTVRSALERVYSIYYAETLEYLRLNAIMSESRAILGSMLSIKPLLSIEEGNLMVTEKVRTRTQAIDQLVEYLLEFEGLDDAVIMQARPNITEQTRVLQDRLSGEFVGRHFPFAMYGAALAALIGVDATGVVILESEIEQSEDDFSED
jgi:DegV family protein with EDD domain